MTFISKDLEMESAPFLASALASSVLSIRSIHILIGKCCRLSYEAPIKFQILTVVSLEVVATTKGLSECMHTPYTSEWLQFKTCTHVIVTVSHSLTVESQDELRRSQGASLCHSNPLTRDL